MQKFFRVGATLYFLTADGLSTSHRENFPSINAAKRQSRHLQKACRHQFFRP